MRVSRIPYVHAFGLTPRRAVIVGHPLEVPPLDLVWSNRFVDHYAWRPEQGTTLHAVDRWSGDVQRFELEAMFVFHVINAFDEEGTTVVDVLAYADPSVLLERMRVASLAERAPDLRPRPMRIRLSHREGRASAHPLADLGFEFPTIHHRRHAGRPYRVTWGASNEPDGAALRSKIVRTDVVSGAQRTVDGGRFVFGEPVHVAPRDATREDDGVLLAVGADPVAETSKLIALRADTLDVVAEAELALPIPLGYHGSFVRA